MRERKPGTWELIVPIGKDALTGRPRYRSRSLRGTKKEAERALRELCAEVEAGRATGADVTFGHLLNQWLDATKETLSPTTHREYQRLMTKRIIPAMGEEPLWKVSAIQLDRFYVALSRQTGLGPSSIRQIHSIIRRALRQGVRWGWIAANPAVNATPPRQRKTELQPPDATMLRKLIAAADAGDPTIGALIRIAAMTGMRRGELCGLRWSAVDLDAAKVVIRRSIVPTAGGTIDKDTKTHSARRISLDAASVEVLRLHRARAEALTARLGAVLASDAFVFSPDPVCERPLHPDSVTHAFMRLCARLGIEGVRLHDLRHAHATQLLAAGVPVRTVSGRLGHANASTTLNVYAHWVEESDDAAADTMSQLIDGPREPALDPRHSR